MLYEYNSKIYVKPFSNKLVEVEVEKRGSEYNVKATEKTVYITPMMKSKLTEVSLEEAYKKDLKSSKTNEL